MPDQTVPVLYPNTTSTTTRELDPDRQPPHTKPPPVDHRP